MSIWAIWKNMRIPRWPIWMVIWSNLDVDLDVDLEQSGVIWMVNPHGRGYIFMTRFIEQFFYSGTTFVLIWGIWTCIWGAIWTSMWVIWTLIWTNLGMRMVPHLDI